MTECVYTMLPMTITSQGTVPVAIWVTSCHSCSVSGRSFNPYAAEPFLGNLGQRHNWVITYYIRKVSDGPPYLVIICHSTIQGDYICFPAGMIHT